MMEQFALPGLRGGETARDEALVLLELTRREWLEQARAVATWIARRRGQVTVDDVRQRCPVPKGWDPRMVGATFKDRRFEKVGYRQSTRPECHARPIAIFRLREP